MSRFARGSDTTVGIFGPQKPLFALRKPRNPLATDPCEDNKIENMFKT